MSKKYTIEDMRELAYEHGGKCLSTEYRKLKMKLDWKCENGHMFSLAPADMIYKGHWCPHCSNRKPGSIERMQELAQRHNGKCLSEEYVNMKTKLKWECENGHTWETSPSNIIKGTWCPFCAGRGHYTIEDMKSLAKEKGGECLSRRYINGSTELKWKCSEGHIWDAKPSSIKRGSWCPVCSRFKSERLCRIILEGLLNIKLPKKRPAWLLSGSGKRMEFDGFDEKNRIAFEYQGIQHYENTFNVDEEKWKHFRHNDEIKLQLAKDNGVKLIVVPYFEEGATIDECVSHVKCVLKENGIEYNDIDLDIREKDFSSYLLKEDLERIVKRKGGELLTDVVVTTKSKVKIKCKNGHIWTTTVSLIKSGAWCYKCGRQSMKEKMSLSLDEVVEFARQHSVSCLSSEYENADTILSWRCNKCGYVWNAPLRRLYNTKECCPHCQKTIKFNSRYTIEDMKNIARERGGKCLSDIYVNIKTKLRWQCKEGHIWEATPDSIRRGTWCPTCNRGETVDLERIKQIVEKHNGECFTNEYTGKKQRIVCKCENGHVWETSVMSLLANHWCPTCAGNPRLSVDDMRLAAEERGGEFLEDDYKDAHTKMKWKCHLGHVFESNYNRIQQGGWCPKCAKIQQAKRQTKHTIEEMQEIAKSRGGECLSKEYVRSHDHLKWKCKEGHVWNASYGNISKGKWCPICARRRK